MVIPMCVETEMGIKKRIMPSNHFPNRSGLFGSQELPAFIVLQQFPDLKCALFFHNQVVSAPERECRAGMQENRDHQADTSQFRIVFPSFFDRRHTGPFQRHDYES